MDNATPVGSSAAKLYQSALSLWKEKASLLWTIQWHLGCHANSSSNSGTTVFLRSKGMPNLLHKMQ